MDSTTPVSNNFIRSPPLSNQQNYGFLNQRQPQSFLFNSIAHPLSSPQHKQIVIPKQHSLQRKQQNKPLVESAANHLKHNNIQKDKFATAQNANQQIHSHLSLALNKGFVCRNSPPPSHVIEVDKNKQKHHPQIWCGKGQTEPTVSKHVYNYAQRKSSSEKTPMCRVAELTRYNKLRHSYVLLDESGPAHKKKFTVKLILCPGQEFEGSGPSIKKAQQAAAQCALDSSTLPRPPIGTGAPRRSTRKDPCNAILLLNSVAAELGIVINYKEELLRHPLISLQSSTINPQISWAFPYCNISNNNKLSPISILQSNDFNPMNLCLATPPKLFNTSFHNPVRSTTKSTNAQYQIVPTSKSLTSVLDLPVTTSSIRPSFPLLPNVSTHSPLFDYRYFSLLPSSFLTVPSSLLLNGLDRTNGIQFSPTALNSRLCQQQQQHGFTYKVTISLSLDSSEHFGFDMQLTIAKQKAAIQALDYLKPVLGCYKRSKELDENLEGIFKYAGAANKFNSIERSPHDTSISDSAEDESFSTDSNFSPALNALLNNVEEQQIDDKEANNDQLYKQNSENGIPPIAASTQHRQFRSRRKTKSVVSQIHECALRLRMNVEFEVLAETGEPHNRVYTLRCRLISPSTTQSDSSAVCNEYTSEGQGPSKKSAKQAACYQLLEKVRPIIDDDPIFLASQIVRNAGSHAENQKRSLTQGIGESGKEFLKRKTIVKDKKIDPEYGHHINPISRLIQVMQVRQEREPIFHFISENGQNRHKEFTVSVNCMGLQEKGTGPNKKLAKRAAAEAMLSRIGYIKSMPQPGKSLLKKKDQHQRKNSMMNPIYDSLQTKNWCEHTTSFETFASVEEALRNIECNQITSSPQHTELDLKDVTIDSKNISAKNIFVMDNTITDETENEHNVSPNQEANNCSPPNSSTRRRVTFNEHVSACPPPEDSNYPAASIAPLKSELGSRLRRRNRDSQRVLNQTENQELAKLAANFLKWRNGICDKHGLVNLEDNSIWSGLECVKQIPVDKLESYDSPNIPISSPDCLIDQRHLLQFNEPSMILSSPTLQTTLDPNFAPQLLHTVPPPFTPTITTIGGETLSPHISSSTMFSISSIKTEDNQMEGRNMNKFGLIGAKDFLNQLSKLFKFTVSYSDFPRSKNAANDEQCFTLLTVGLAKPIVCHGSGPTEVAAHTDAAFNAIQTMLKQLGAQENSEQCNSKTN